ncbi:AAA family ATPase [Candidatus Sumerlaeota bacterium]|nr:AAA family ATPase [Candidatus Sumerlaeota bacterium]
MARQIALAKLQRNIETVIKGKSDVIRQALMALLSRGHLLIEDVPGVGKTTLAHLLATSISCSFSRIQFTSDLLPSDILGVTIYRAATGEFEFQRGPIFANVVLADEINRTTPKTQSALLEAMNSAQVSIEKQTHDLPKPFMVIATQNPVEFHGTFPLPKSQMDRFLMRLHMGYPELADEVTVLREQRVVGDLGSLEPVVTAEEVFTMQDEVTRVRLEDDLLDYIARVAAATRESTLIELGVSTRGALALRAAAQARAYLEGRDYCVPDDIKEMILPVLAHRIQVAKTFELSGMNRHEDESVLLQVVDSVEVPI